MQTYTSQVPAQHSAAVCFAVVNSQERKCQNLKTSTASARFFYIPKKEKKTDLLVDWVCTGAALHACQEYAAPDQWMRQAQQSTFSDGGRRQPFNYNHMHYEEIFLINVPLTEIFKR